MLYAEEIEFKTDFFPQLVIMCQTKQYPLFRISITIIVR
jgi:hypothetical protein